MPMLPTDTPSLHAPAGASAGFHASAGVAIHLFIGQHVRHEDFQGAAVTGKVIALSIEDRALMATIVLDRPIVIKPSNPGERDIELWRQHVPAIELTPFDGRDALMAIMLEALRSAADMLDVAEFPEGAQCVNQVRAAIAQAEAGYLLGSA